MTRAAAEYADLARTDLDLARACASLERARRTQGGVEASDPQPLAQHRAVSGRRALQILDELAPSSADGPRVRAQARMVLHLAIARIGFESGAEVAAARAIADAGVEIAGTPPSRVPWTDAARALVEVRVAPAMDPVLTAMAARGPAIAAANRRLGETSFEAARQLGLPHPEARFVASAEGVEGVIGAAQTFLDRTEALWTDLVAHARRRAAAPVWRPVDTLALALAPDAPRGWPSRITARWFAEILPGLAKRAEIAPDSLPAALGGASFARALGVFGAALMRPPASLPFSLARDPTAPRALLFSALFAGLPGAAIFHARVLGEPAGTARDQARALSRAILFAGRKAAFDAILARTASASADAWNELSFRVFGAPVPATLAGAWPRRRPDAVCRFEAWLLARDREGDLVRRFDEDWFRNPRAEAALLAEASGPARDFEPHPEGQLAPAAEDAARRFQEVLA